MNMNNGAHISGTEVKRGNVFSQDHAIVFSNVIVKQDKE
jgi:hypothetical protein